MNLSLEVNNIETASMSSSPSSDYIAGEGDDNSDSKTPVPGTLKSVEDLLSLNEVKSKIQLSFI